MEIVRRWLEEQRILKSVHVKAISTGTTPFGREAGVGLVEVRAISRLGILVRPGFEAVLQGSIGGS
jgi:hypothetical protein